MCNAGLTLSWARRGYKTVTVMLYTIFNEASLQISHVFISWRCSVLGSEPFFGPVTQAQGSATGHYQPYHIRPRYRLCLLPRAITDLRPILARCTNQNKPHTCDQCMSKQEPCGTRKCMCNLQETIVCKMWRCSFSDLSVSCARKTH